MISQLTTSVEQFLAARQVMHAKKPAEKKIEVEVVQAEMVDDNQSAASSQNQADNDVSAASNMN